jgi:hypothetical protein
MQVTRRRGLNTYFFPLYPTILTALAWLTFVAPRIKGAGLIMVLLSLIVTGVGTLSTLDERALVRQRGRLGRIVIVTTLGLIVWGIALRIGHANFNYQ